MSEDKVYLSDKVRATIDYALKKYPKDQKQSAVKTALHAVQEEQGWLSEGYMNAVAEYLDMSAIAVYEVASFYTLYNLEKVGKHKISVCTNISCMLKGSDKIVCHLKDKLKIDFNETTSDGKYTLEEVECIAACCGAPAVRIDNDYHENLTSEKLDKILTEVE